MQWLCATPHNAFLIDSLSKKIFLEGNLATSKKRKIFITVFTTIYWVKPAWPAEPIFIISTLLIVGPSDDAS